MRLDRIWDAKIDRYSFLLFLFVQTVVLVAVVCFLCQTCAVRREMLCPAGTYHFGAGACEICVLRGPHSGCTGALSCDCILQTSSSFSNEAIKETNSLHSLPVFTRVWHDSTSKIPREQPIGKGLECCCISFLMRKTGDI